MTDRSHDADGAPQALVLDLVEWVARAPRCHADVMEVWRTSCPRLQVWEEAVARGLVARQGGGARAGVVVTAAGWNLLRAQHRLPSP